MLDINEIRLSDLNSDQLIPIKDDHIAGLKASWYGEPQKSVSHQEFVDQASTWFMSTQLNNLSGHEQFPHIDIIIGCTHYIESLVSKNRWNIQILPREYAYYSVMGHRHNEIGSLAPGVPLIISLPNYFFGMREEWDTILTECEQKEIDIHVDCAWVTAAKGFNFNFDHPNIKSFAMSMSKYGLGWNRIGLRWSRQRTMDSCTLISAQKKYNELTTACGSYMMRHIPRDYGWNTYGETVTQICEKLDLQETMYFYVVKDEKGNLYSLGDVLGKIKL